MSTKTLSEMAQEIYEVNVANGWYEDARSLVEDVALLHTEVSEAFEAYRDHGFDDATETTVWTTDHREIPNPHTPKPEGVGSELADILIRLLDTGRRLGWDLAEIATRRPALDWPDASFALIVVEMHQQVGRIADAPAKRLAGAAFLYSLILLAERKAEVDLDAEYERKLAYNRTRGHKHGGKRL
jgi:hypothetical protein